jgi:hypothetical protein
LLATDEASFYEATAQVLPVFLLVMVFGEARLQKRRDGTPPESLRLHMMSWIFSMLLIIGGELASLRVLLRETQGVWEHALAVGGLAMGLSFVVMWMLLSGLDEYRDDFSPETRAKQRRLIFPVTFLCIAGTFLALR